MQYGMAICNVKCICKAYAIRNVKCTWNVQYERYICVHVICNMKCKWKMQYEIVVCNMKCICNMESEKVHAICNVKCTWKIQYEMYMENAIWNGNL